jgi:hypothetical protein
MGSKMIANRRYCTGDWLPGRTAVPGKGKKACFEGRFIPDLSTGSTRCPDVSKKQKNFDTSLWLCKQFQECGVEKYLLPPGLL